MKNATLFTMIDASLAYAIYRDHRDGWPQPVEALLAAYEHYANRRRMSRELSFDRVFYIVCWTDQLWAWTGREAAFRFTACDRCHCRYLASPTSVENHARDCPFCKLQLRYGRDPLYRNRFPQPQHPQISAALAEIMNSLGRPAEPS